MRAQEFVKQELAPPPVPEPKLPLVQLNHSVRADVYATVDELADKLGWSKVKVISTAIKAFGLMVEEEMTDPRNGPAWLRRWAREQIDAHYEAKP